SSAVVISYFCILIIITAFINGFSNSQIMRKK
ncbi:ABC transporter permease, partial [Moraxella catarrhalis]|nr:ABC transporter permease [Moraxella catarrhalis]